MPFPDIFLIRGKSSYCLQVYFIYLQLRLSQKDSRQINETGKTKDSKQESNKK